MSDPIRRALRTLFQFIAGGGIAAIITEVIAKVDDPLAQVSIAAVGAFLVALAQNELEDRGAIPAFGKAPASDGANPVPDDHGQSTLGIAVAALVIACVCLALLLL